MSTLDAPDNRHKKGGRLVVTPCRPLRAQTNCACFGYVTEPWRQGKDTMVTTAETDTFSKARRARAPENPRHNEKVGGGIIVIERTPKKQRLRPASWPYELGSVAEAVSAINRLQETHPDRSFCIFQQVAFAERKQPSPEARQE